MWKPPNAFQRIFLRDWSQTMLIENMCTIHFFLEQNILFCLKMFLLGCCNLFSNSVEVSLSLWSQSETSIGVSLHYFEPLRSLHHLLGHALGSTAKVAWHDAIALATTIDFCHGANTSATTEVQVTNCGSSTGVEPVPIIRCQFLVFGKFNCVYPFWYF